MKQFRITPIEMVESFLSNYALMCVLVKRDISIRYRGSIIGVFWSFVHPILMLIVYTFVFNVTFNARWSDNHQSKAEFALILFSGLILFNLFSECVSRAPSLIISRANYVKKVVFPLEILPWVSLGSALFQCIVSFAAWLLFYIGLYGLPHPSLLLLPYILLPILLIIMGLSWFFSSLSVYIRDIQPIVTIGMTILMFISPIFYPLSALPNQYQSLMKFNPIAPAIEALRTILYSGHAPSFFNYNLYIIFSFCIAYLGFAWFQKTRKGFSDAI